MFGRSVQILFILFFFFGSIVSLQGNQGNEKNNEKLKKEILSVFKSKGEDGLRNFTRNKKDIIRNKFIVTLAKSGYKERNIEWLIISKVLAEEKKDPKTLGDVLYRMGNYYSLISNNKKAIDCFDKALPLLEKVKFLQRLGNVFSAKGMVYYYTGDHLKALQMYDKAFSFFQKTKRPIGQGNIYMSKGIIYFEMGDNTRAIEMYEKALPFFKIAREPLGQGNIYLCIGNIYLRSGDNSKAIEMYNRALPFFEKKGEPLGQGNVRMWKGDIYLRTGENSKALDMYEKALPFFKKAKRPACEGEICVRKGDIYLKVGGNLRALEMYERSLFFYKKAENPIGQAQAYTRKGNVYLITGDTSKASEVYAKALPIYKRANQPLSQGNIYLKKGYIYLKTGENSKAMEMYDKSLPFFERARDILGQAHLFSGKGEIFLKLGDNLKSLEMYNKALLFFEKAGDVEMESLTFHEKAKVLVNMGKKCEALHLFQKGIDRLEKVRSQTSSSEMKKLFMSKVYKKYEEAVMFMLQNKYLDKGLKYAEAMRSRVFLDRMAEGLVRLDKGLAPDQKEIRDNLVAKLSLLSKEMNTAAGKGDEKKLQEFKKQYRIAEREFEELLVKIRLNNPFYAAVQYPQPVTVKELQENVLEKDDLLLRYFISQENVYVFLVSKMDFKVFPLAVKEKDIQKATQEYLFAIEEKNAWGVKNYGRQLYRKLFKPLVTAIKESKDIIIIPDGDLAKIPFESLVIDDANSSKTVYLLEKYRLKYIQSASILSILRKHYQRKESTKRFIGFGDPVYDFENFKQGNTEIGTPSPLTQDAISGMHRGRYEREGGIFTRLESSGEEINTIARLFKAHSQNSIVNLRENASETNAKLPGINQFDYIHFACHAILGDGFQSLVLSQLPENTDDGFLTLNEIMNCDYNAKLVVLSACRTGKGKMERGEGVTGLTRAVMYAGTPAVVASLWDVDDVATKDLMVRFYKYMLEEELDKEDALRTAKLDLIKSKKYSSPFFWSAFVMYGE